MNEMNESILHTYLFFSGVQTKMEAGSTLASAIQFEIKHSHREALLRMQEALPELAARITAELRGREREL